MQTVKEEVHHKTYYTLETNEPTDTYGFLSQASYTSLQDARDHLEQSMKSDPRGTQYRIVQNTEIVLPTVEIERKVKG